MLNRFKLSQTGILFEIIFKLIRYYTIITYLFLKKVAKWIWLWTSRVAKWLWDLIVDVSPYVWIGIKYTAIALYYVFIGMAMLAIMILTTALAGDKRSKAANGTRMFN